MIPVYIVCGFLGAGKSYFINEQLRLRKKMASTAVLAFEEGCTALANLSLSFSIDALDQELLTTSVTLDRHQGIESNTIGHTWSNIVTTIATYIETAHPKEIWIEWNGTVPFPVLESILYHPLLSTLCRIERVMFITNDYHMNTLVPAMGDILRSQLYSADIVVTNEATATQFTSSTTTLSSSSTTTQSTSSSSTSSSISTSTSSTTSSTTRSTTPSMEMIRRQLTKPHLPWTLYIITAFITAYLLLVTIFRHDIPYGFHQILAVTSGLILEGIPFLLLGTIVATAIRFFVPDHLIFRHLQGDSYKSYAIAMSSGLALPVCDCATIPMFKALLDKGVPQHIALLFMLASPIMNPIAILATYYAFPNNESILLWRILLGLLVAFLVSFTFKWRPHRFTQKQSTINKNNYIYNSAALGNSKKRLFLFHTEREFLQLLAYFSIAAFVIAIFQVWLKPLLLAADWTLPIWASHIVLLGFAFIFSLCSTSDAIIGRSLSTLFPLSSVLGFLVLGPMMDIKNAYILNQYIGTSFTKRLAVTIFIITIMIISIFQFLIN